MTTEHARSETRPSTRQELDWTIEAAQDKKATAVTLLDLTQLGVFTDYFLLCSGASARQVQAISEEIEEQLGRRGVRLEHREGYAQAEWVLLDYGGFLVHVFSDRSRQFYDLERLWRAAQRTNFPDVDSGAAEQEAGK